MSSTRIQEAVREKYGEIARSEVGGLELHASALPRRAAGLSFASRHAGSIEATPPASSRLRYSAVVGSIMPRIRVMRFAGKPPRSAWVRTAASSGAM